MIISPQSFIEFLSQNSSNNSNVNNISIREFVSNISLTKLINKIYIHLYIFD